MHHGHSYPPVHTESWPPGRQYLAVLRAVEEEWERCEFQLREFPAWAERFKRCGFDIHPLRFVLVSEWSAAKGHDVAGHLVRAWVRDAGGLRAVPKEEFERWSSQDRLAPPRHASVAFHACDDGQHVVYAIVLGPRGGHGGQCWIDPADPRLNRFQWIS